MSHESDPKQTLERALTLLRSHTTGTLLRDGTPYDSRYIIDPGDGSLIMTVDRDVFGGDDIVLAVPEDRFDTPMRVNLMIDEIEECHATDRFLAYHTQQDRPVWARGKIGFAKIDSGGVADGDALMAPNPLSESIGPLCKRLNSEPKALRGVCKLLAHVDIEHPVAVGVDDEGCDVRAEFGVVRVQWPSRVADADTCEQVIASLIGGVI